jgi:hypothetical protein
LEKPANGAKQITLITTHDGLEVGKVVDRVNAINGIDGGKHDKQQASVGQT